MPCLRLGAEGDVPMADFVLKFDNNVIEHLGLKLYQNKPTRVIAEVISNSWDADAREVLVNMNMDSGERWIAVLDDGHGMVQEDLKAQFLVIGRNKRASRQSGSKRLPMGRKGIGKLAPFGIARIVDVATAGRTKDGSLEVTWLRLNLNDLLLQGATGAYPLEEVFSGSSLEDVPIDMDPTGQVVEWILHLQRDGATGCGTLILMSSLSLRKAISADQLIGALGSRFTVTLKDLLTDSFAVSVNGVAVEATRALPVFEFRVPEGNGYEVATVGDHEVRFWVGFVKQAEWPQDQAGIGVYAHGKIAQDRPFTFGARGQEIWTRYMYGVIEADWLDELPEDLISTDRTSVNWDADAARPLFVWGQKKIGEWARRFADWRKTKEREENERRLKEQQEAGTAPNVTAAEQEQIVQLVSQITPRMGKDETAKSNVVKAVSDAWVQKPMQKLVKDLWSELGETDLVAPEAFATMVTQLSAYGVPESLNLAVVFAQRAFALTKLYEYVHHGTEPDLQRLVERFPWIIEPDAVVLTANQTLRTVLERAAEEGQIPSGRRSNVGGTPDRNKPDFVFLSSPEEHEIVVVELKTPQADLTVENRRQLEDYLSYLEVHYPNATISGVLVGRNPNKMEAKYKGTRIIEWTEVLKRSRARHLELLAAMLIQAADGSKGDARIDGALKLGGPEAQALLQKLSGHHGELQKVMGEFEARKAAVEHAAKADGCGESADEVVATAEPASEDV